MLAQAAGRGKLVEVHPSPDYIAGTIHFANGVRGVIECGEGALDVREVEYWWRECRVGALGTKDLRRRSPAAGEQSTRNGAELGGGSMDYEIGHTG